MYSEEILLEIMFFKVVRVLFKGKKGGRAMESQWNQGFNTVVKVVKQCYQGAVLS